MCYLYIIENSKGKHYVGITALHPEKRLERHNRGEVFSTKSNKPWKIIYVEVFDNLKRAREKERLVKSWHGGNAFKKFLATAARSSNGRTSPSGGEYLGSNPSLAAVVGKNKFGGVK